MRKKHLHKKRVFSFFKTRKYRRRIVQLLVITIYFFGGAEVVMADSFGAGWDTAQCFVGMTESLSVGSLPATSALVYDRSIVTKPNPNFISNTTFNNLANMYYPNAHRFGDIASDIKVAPLSSVDVGLYWFNYAGHDVYLRDGFLFLSKESGGNICNMITEECKFKRSNFVFNGNNIVRQGWGIDVNADRRISANSGDTFGLTLKTLHIRQPLKIVNQSVSYEFTQSHALMIFFEIEVLNDSSYLLHDVRLEHRFKDFYKTEFDLLPNERKTIKYFANYGLKYPHSISLGYPVVRDLDAKRECATVGSDSPISSNPETRMLLIKRNDLPTYENHFGVQPDMLMEPAASGFCITLVPYSVLGEIMTLKLDPKLTLQTSINDSKEIRLEVGEVRRVHVNVYNSGARADDLLVNISANKNLEISNADCDLRRVEDKYIWNIGTLHNNVQVSCNFDVKVLVDDRTKTGDRALHIYTSLLNRNNKLLDDRLIVHNYIWNTVNLDQEGFWLDDETAEFDVQVKIEGNIASYNSVVKTMCDNCSKNISYDHIENFSDLRFEDPYDFAPGVYTFKVFYKINDFSSTATVKNCISFINNSVSRKVCSQLIKDKEFIPEESLTSDITSLNDQMWEFSSESIVPLKTTFVSYLKPLSKTAPTTFIKEPIITNLQNNIEIPVFLPATGKVYKSILVGLMFLVSGLIIKFLYLRKFVF